MSKRLEGQVEKLNSILQKSQLEDIAHLLGSKKRMLWVNFMAGITRGVGIGIGFTIITALVIILLQRMVVLNIPVIGEYIADIVEIIETK